MIESPELNVAQYTRKPAVGAFSIERVFEAIFPHFPPQIRIRTVRNRHLSKGLLPRLKDTWQARAHQGEVNHILGDVHYLSLLLRGDRTLLTVHDTRMVERKRGLVRFVLWLFWIWLPVRHVSHVTVISERTKSDLLALVRCDPDKITVIGNPLTQDFRLQPPAAHDGPFRLLHIGTKENKNLERVMLACEGLDVELTVIGKLVGGQEEQLERLPRTRTLSDLSDAELEAEYTRSDALIFVSLSEGFGLPIIEAQAIGRPVITSARSPMDHVSGEAALLVDPENESDIRAAILQLKEDSGQVSRLVTRGLENARRYSPSVIAKQYADLYWQIAHKQGSHV